MTVFNLTDIEARKAADDEGVLVVLKDERGEPYTANDDGSVPSITVLGRRSKAVRKARMKNAMAFAKLRENATGDLALDHTLDAIEDGNIEIAVAATKAWTGIVSDGTPVPCTPENARRLYLMAPHIVAQLTEAQAAKDADFRGGRRAVPRVRRARGQARAGDGRQADGAPAPRKRGGAKRKRTR